MIVHIYTMDNRTGRMRPIGFFRASGQYSMSRYGVGSLQLSVSTTNQSARAVTIDTILCVNDTYWYIVTGIGIARTDSPRISITAAEIKSIINRRQIVPDNTETVDMPMGYDSVSGATETVIKHYIDRHAVSPTNPARIIRGLHIAVDKNRGVADDAYHARYVPLLDTVASIGKIAGLSCTVSVDLRIQKMVFDVAVQRDRTAGQTANKPLILQIERRNLMSSEYTRDASDAANVFYCSRAGDQYEWETLTQTYFSTETEPSGLARRENWLSVSVYDDGNQYEQLQKNAEKEMEDYAETETITAQIAPTMTYGTDYSIGDIATVIDTVAGISADMEITAVTVREADNGATTTEATFGTAKISRFDRLSKKIEKRK